jgi:2-succinyl-5-enolpyruvyl-6-hydroxy-3-cyclohexene-1-carboxylate synthase
VLVNSDDIAAVNLRWALTLIDGLAASGVAHAVISPGSRSTPLALACERHPAIRTWVVLDERSAAFFALGLAKAENRPVAVIGTSGSAPANWFPAVIEANYGAVPLILLSADRPPELRECGANQSIDQIRLFGAQVRFAFDLGVAEATPAALAHVAMRACQAADMSRWPLPGPVHLNVPLREPLVPSDVVEFDFPRHRTAVAYPTLVPPGEALAQLAEELSDSPGLIVCGAMADSSGFADAVSMLAARLDCPVLADPLSGLRFGGHDRSCILTRYDAFLRNPRFVANHRPAWVLRFGALPVSKTLQQYLAAPARHIMVEAHGRLLDPLHQTDVLLHVDAVAVCEALAAMPLKPTASGWSMDFLAAEKSVGASAVALPIEGAVVRAMIEHLPAGSTLFSGNSMPIRDIDGFSGSGAKPLRFKANRGASGIDGNVSTALGMAAAGRGKVAALLGDLTCCHDIGGLLAARGLDATLVVLNNGGGGIFSYLPQAGLEDFERYWLTPAGLNFEQVAKLYGLGFRRAETPQAFAEAFTQALESTGVNLIEVVVDRETSIADHRAYWHAAGNAD